MLQRKPLICLSLVLCVICAKGFAAQSKESTAVTSRSKVYVNGKLLPAGKILVREGLSYVEATTLAEALGASVQAGASSYIITTSPPNNDCGAPPVPGQRFSEQFRSDMAGVADEIESLRAVVQNKKERAPLGPRFDGIDRKLSLSTPHVQTDADMAVYYALSYASNSLAISYYKQSRGASEDEAQKKDQLDSMICSMESKFALMKGVLMPGGTCSVFKRMETQALPKPGEIPHTSSAEPQK
jgi:hypothetical protein